MMRHPYALFENRIFDDLVSKIRHICAKDNNTIIDFIRGVNWRGMSALKMRLCAELHVDAALSILNDEALKN